MSFWDWIVKFISDYWPLYLRGTGYTILLAILGTLLGGIIGLMVGVVRTIPLQPGGSKKTARYYLLKIVNGILSVYINVFRGTPMIVQAMLIYYGLTEAVGLEISSLNAAILIITLNTGAYMSEIVRGGIHAVDAGQTEAAQAVGMTHWQTMRYVALPQTIRNILPATGNEFIVNLKDSSVLNVIMMNELFYVTRMAASTYLRTYEPFVICAAIYLTMTMITSRLLRVLEKKLDGPKNYTIIGSATTPENMLRRPVK